MLLPDLMRTSLEFVSSTRNQNQVVAVLGEDIGKGGADTDRTARNQRALFSHRWVLAIMTAFSMTDVAFGVRRYGASSRGSANSAAATSDPCASAPPTGRHK